MTASQPLITPAPTFRDSEVRRRATPRETCGFVKDDTVTCTGTNKCAALRTEYGSPLWAAPYNDQVAATTYFPTALVRQIFSIYLFLVSADVRQPKESDSSCFDSTSSPYTTCVLETWPALNVQYWECWQRGTDPFLGHTPTYTMNLSSDDATASPWLIYVSTEVQGSISSGILTTVSAPFTGISLMVAGSSSANTQTSTSPTSSTSESTISMSGPTATATLTPSPSSTSSVNIGAITGGAIGAIIILAILLYWFRKAGPGQKRQPAEAPDHGLEPIRPSAPLTKPTSFAPTITSRAAYSEVPNEFPTQVYRDSPRQSDMTSEVEQVWNNNRSLRVPTETSNAVTMDNRSVISGNYPGQNSKERLGDWYREKRVIPELGDEE
ncbi:hypothetical protein G7054_g11594 [Neopestalotiopsis clavispora]|nr:hypothetical protein G7054_g11594 [Neopestalotiopsis clavispora]